MPIDFLLERFFTNGSKTAIIWKGKEYNYLWLNQQINKNIIDISKQNIGEGNVVALRSDFNPFSISMFMSLIALKATIVPVSYAVKNLEEYLTTAEVQYQIDFSEEEYDIHVISQEVKHELLCKLKNTGHPGLVLFSSGSTGKSKAAVHDFLPLLERFRESKRTFRTITFLLFDHIGGVNTMLSILSNGGTIITPEARTPEHICAMIEKYKVELLPTTPTFINMILISHVYEKYNLESLRIVSYGTEGMPEATLKRFHELFPNIELKQTYGLSELGIMNSKSQGSDSLWVKVGGNGFETKIENGILNIKTKTAMLGYLNAPSPFDVDGWFNTQDQVEVDGEWIRFLGRTTDIINVAGQKVYPAEVESVLMSLENIVDASVYGVKNPFMGNVVAARVSLRNKEELSALKLRIRSSCKDKLEAYKIPVHIEIVDSSQVSERFKKVRK